MTNKITEKLGKNPETTLDEKLGTKKKWYEREVKVTPKLVLGVLGFYAGAGYGVVKFLDYLARLPPVPDSTVDFIFGTLVPLGGLAVSGLGIYIMSKYPSVNDKANEQPGVEYK